VTRIRTLVLVLAGGAGGRLELLTRERAKPAVPFAGTHRLIDFPLSNAHNAGLHDVWVIQQFNPISLSDHLANGRPWDLDRTNGGLLILPPRLGHDGRGGFAGGTADALWRNAPMIREFAPRALVILSADAVYALDYGAVVEEHVEAGAEATLVTTRVDPHDAGRYGVVRADGDQVSEYVYKPEDPASDVVSNEVFVFDAERLLDRVDHLGQDNEGQDLGHELLPALVHDGGAREHRFDGFWRDVGTVDAYWSSHQELLADPSPIDLDDQAWPILTQSLAGVSPARVLRGAVIEQSLVAGSARVAGRVERSTIGRGAIVEAGATIRESVLLPGAIVRAGASVERAILDDRVEIGRDARVGGPGDITLLGLAACIPNDAVVGSGSRIPEIED
jgi:glucose-1-phosphate adenylyltransferase